MKDWNKVGWKRKTISAVEKGIYTVRETKSIKVKGL
jgi:DNA-binding XRE family transcriptional regulator